MEQSHHLCVASWIIIVGSSRHTFKPLWNKAFWKVLWNWGYPGPGKLLEYSTYCRYILAFIKPAGKKEYLLKIANTSYFHLLWKKKKVKFQSHSFTEGSLREWLDRRICWTPFKHHVQKVINTLAHFPFLRYLWDKCIVIKNT